MNKLKWSEKWKKTATNCLMNSNFFSPSFHTTNAYPEIGTHNRKKLTLACFPFDLCCFSINANGYGARKLNWIFSFRKSSKCHYQIKSNCSMLPKETNHRTQTHARTLLYKVLHFVLSKKEKKIIISYHLQPMVIFFSSIARASIPPAHGTHSFDFILLLWYFPFFTFLAWTILTFSYQFYGDVRC